MSLQRMNRCAHLVKVPRYMVGKWEKTPSYLEVGKLKIIRHADRRPKVSLELSEAVIKYLDGGTESMPVIPKHYVLDATSLSEQTFGAFSQISANMDENYMKLEFKGFEKAQKPERIVKSLNKLPKKFMPKSRHEHLVEYERKEKIKDKQSRQDDKNTVLEILFKAFDEHQFYTLHDLVSITKRPACYLKKILKEYCHCKTVWELKPEYQLYNAEEILNIRRNGTGTSN